MAARQGLAAFAIAQRHTPWYPQGKHMQPVDGCEAVHCASNPFRGGPASSLRAAAPGGGMESKRTCSVGRRHYCIAAGDRPV
jgi:hypothetical protein